MKRHYSGSFPAVYKTAAPPLHCWFLLLLLSCDVTSCGPDRTAGDSGWMNMSAAWCFNDRLQASAALCATGTACRENTGYRGAGIDADDLVPSGGIEVLRAGTVIEGMDITGSVEVKAPRVTVRNCRIRSADRYPVRVFPAGSLVIEHTEIIGAFSSEAAVAAGNCTARRLDIHGSRDGFRAGSNVIIEGCYIHHLAAHGGPRNNGIRLLSGRNVLIRNNCIEMPPVSSSAIMIATDSGPIDNVLIYGNIVKGGKFIIHSRAGSHVPPVEPTNVRINNNRMGRDFRQGLFYTSGTTTFSGNVWLDSGQAVPLPY
ncbi:MAG TPA: right-handed parallel beta-helix repeat-containing protein [Spirochaetota bacterium]|nr:right-handed parallel beta-helix repeat-containing protein [Spirochaetota bacterium]